MPSSGQNVLGAALNFLVFPAFRISLHDVPEKDATLVSVLFTVLDKSLLTQVTVSQHFNLMEGRTNALLCCITKICCLWTQMSD